MINSTEKAPPSSSSSKGNNLTDSLAIKVILLLLTSIYLLAGVSSFIVVTLAPESQISTVLRNKLVWHGIENIIITFVCASAFVLAIKTSKYAVLAVGCAACATGYIALKALASSMISGFHSYHLIEMLIVLPSTAFIVYRLFRRKSDNQNGEGSLGS